MREMKTLTLQTTKYEVVDEVAREQGGNGGGDVPAVTEFNRVNVRDYGAVGDGVADDRPAIIAAFNAAKSMLPCEVYFPAGTYGIGSGITIEMEYGTGGLRVCGAGRDVTTIKYLDDYTSQYGWYAIRIWPVGRPGILPAEEDYLHDISYTGLTVYDPDPIGHALNTAKGDSATEETHGFDIHCCKGVSVTDCQFITVGDEAIDICFCHDVVVMNNRCIGSPGAGTHGGAIAIGDGCDGVVVIGNTINGSAPDETLEDGTVIQKYNLGIAIESGVAPVRNVVIANNTILSVQGSGIGMSAKNEGCAVHNATITDNIITGCNVGISSSGLKLKDGVIISNNNISDCRKLHGANGRGIDLEGTHTDVVMRGNTIRSTEGVSAYFACSAKDVIVFENNIIKDAGNCAMYLAGGEFIIRDCTITNTGLDSASPGSGAIYYYGTPIIRVYRCRVTGVRQSKGITNATVVEDTIVEMVDADGNAVADKSPLSGSTLKRLVNCQVEGMITIGQDGAIVQGVTTTCSSSAPAITVSASGVMVTGCQIHHTGKVECIKEKGTVDGNLFINNILSNGSTVAAVVTIVGANTVAKNMERGAWVDNTVTA